MARTSRVLAGVVAVLAFAIVLSACAGPIPRAETAPRLSPPVIARPGVLRAVVDVHYPPFAGVVGRRPVGLDVDVASAIADRLGLRLDVIDGRSVDASGLVQSGRADLLLGGLSVQSALATGALFAATYISDAPAVFSAREASVGIADLGNRRVAVQKDSPAYWLLLDEYGSRHLVVMPTLRDALTAAAEGQVDFAAGDAVVSGYIMRDLFGLKYAGQLAAGYPLGIGVPSDRPQLANEVRSIVDDMAAKGVLATLRRKWVGDLPEPRMALDPSSSVTTIPSP